VKKCLVLRLNHRVFLREWRRAWWILNMLFYEYSYSYYDVGYIHGYFTWISQLSGFSRDCFNLYVIQWAIFHLLLSASARDGAHKNIQRAQTLKSWGRSLGYTWTYGDYNGNVHNKDMNIMRNHYHYKESSDNKLWNIMRLIIRNHSTDRKRKITVLRS